MYFVDAGRLLQQRNVPVRFWLIGEPDPGNTETITQDELCAWGKEGCVELLGYRSDIACLFSQANIVVLPSYYGEGLPKTLVEAAACGRAVVTTDHLGCRDAIESGKSGLLVPVKDSVALAYAIQKLIDDPGLCQSMGRAGRALAERKFSIKKIVDEHLRIYKELEETA
jgi:glycosyltransferase involved in cell wall biosynthesis